MPSLEQTRDLLRKEGFDAECMVADISKEDDCATLVNNAVSKFGRIDILHNNVGIGGRDGDTVNIEKSAWDNIFNVNLDGAMLISKHVLPIMRSQKSGSIAHVSSVAAIASYPLVAYKTSKAALHEFVRWLAFENAPYNIRCNVLLLGLIDTPMAIDGYHRATGTPRDTLRKQRDAQVRWVPTSRAQSYPSTAACTLAWADPAACLPLAGLGPCPEGRDRWSTQTVKGTLTA